MSLTNVIDQIATQLAKQRARSVDNGDATLSRCRYRGVNDTMCAVGCVIPDSLAPQLEEGQGVRTLINKYPEVRLHLQELMPEQPQPAIERILAGFQSFHDQLKFDHWDVIHYGVRDTYSELVEKFKSKTDEELKEALVQSMTAIANKRGAGNVA